MLVYVYEEDQVYQFHISGYTSLFTAATASTAWYNGMVRVDEVGSIRGFVACFSLGIVIQLFLRVIRVIPENRAQYRKILKVLPLLLKFFPQKKFHPLLLL